MKLVYRGIKYSSNNSIALKIVQEHKHKINKIIFVKKANKLTISYKFPLSKYIRQLFAMDSNFVTNPYKFWYKYRAKFLEKCWKLSDITILNSCWKITLEKEQGANTIEDNSPIEFKYRGVTYYKFLD